MIRWRLALTLFRKEITETLRDRKTLLMSVGLPLLLYPLVAMALTKLQESQSEAQEAALSKIAIWGKAPAQLMSVLQSSNKMEFVQSEGLEAGLEKQLIAGTLPPWTASNSNTNTNATLPDHPLVLQARGLLDGLKADAALVVWSGFESTLSTGGLSQVVILYDSVREKSTKAHQRLLTAIQTFRKDEIGRREKAYGLPAGFSRAVQIEDKNVALEKRQTGKLLGTMLPFVLIILSASGGLYAAIDFTAGEKERNTLQTLLCAPLTSLEIIVGKFLAAWAIVLLTTLANLASMAATFTRIMSSAGVLHTSPATYGVAFLVLLPATFMLTAIFLSIAVFARDFKDGQNLLTPMFMLLTIPLGATMLPGIELNAWTSAVPLVNIALLMKGVFIGEATLHLVFITLLSSVLYAGLALAFAAKVFQEEQVLLGGRDSWKAVLRFQKPAQAAPPTPTFAWTAFAAVFVIVFYVGQLLQGSNTVVMILATQYGFFLIPNLLMAWWWRFPRQETYPMRRPSVMTLLGAVLVGLSAWGVTAGIVTRVFPPPESFAKGLEKVLLFEGMNVPLVAVWFLLGITPAICEELFFRGLILSGFRRLGPGAALFLSSLLFAVAHSSIYRLLPTFTLGLLLGYCALRSRSLIPGMIIHAINNSLLVTLVHVPDLAKKLGMTDLEYVPWSWSLGMGLVTCVGMFLIFRDKAGSTAHSAPAAD